MRNAQQSALGVTVKSGWAMTVLLMGPAAIPKAVSVRRIDLSDPSIPDARQPYHDGFGTARATGPELTRLITSVKRFGGASVRDLIAEHARAYALRGIGIVVGSLADPETLGSSHVRIHALEGQLFRSVVIDAADACALEAPVWRERDLFEHAVTVLRRSEADLRRALVALDRPPGGSWRAEHKNAALAAWMLL